MKIVVLGSGSKGNCTYIETPHAKILIDAGLSMLQIKNRLNNQGIELTTLDAVFITHEHSDHINNLVSILIKTNATLYIEASTYTNCNKRLRNGLVNLPVKFIKPDSRYNICDVSVVPIKLSHDTEVCLGYLVKQLDTDKNITFASITDTGYIPKKYFQILSFIRVLLIESNHDVEMLLNSGRPWNLINRILSDRGHMSNKQCCDHLKQFLSKHNEIVILAHISEECNEYSLAHDFCLKEFNYNIPFDLQVALQYVELPVINLED